MGSLGLRFEDWKVQPSISMCDVRLIWRLMSFFWKKVALVIANHFPFSFSFPAGELACSFFPISSFLITLSLFILLLACLLAAVVCFSRDR